jgi:hypothetical protein
MTVDPWFRRRPRWAVAVAVALFAGVLVVRLAVGQPADATADLYVFPVGLIALAFGLWPAVAAGALSVLLMYAWISVGGGDPSTLGWLSHATPVLLVGVLLGDASDRLTASQRMRSELALASQRHREAIEINDSLVQGMAATKWLLEAGRESAALQTLDETLESGQRLVSQLLRDANLGLRVSS